MLYPLLFSSIFKDYLWGGSSIYTHFSKGEKDACIAESWELSDRDDAQSIIKNGPLKGLSLSQLVLEQADHLFGPGATFKRFPLLLKIIDANKPLSVQVHPKEKAAKALGGEPKTECWHILKTTPDAKIYAGFKSKLSQEEVATLTAKNEVADHLQTFEAKPSQTYFIPSGTVHAIGAGCLLFEVQQNSNTTYRLDDWGRVDSEGKPRDLHIEEALASLDVERDHMPLQTTKDLPSLPGTSKTHLSTTPFFGMIELSLHQPMTPYQEEGCHILFCKEGQARLETDKGSFMVSEGQTVLMPYSCCATHIHKLSEKLTFLHITVPRNP